MIQGHPYLTAEHILSKITEEELFRTYCTNFEKVDEFFASELRKETKPSCKITDMGGFLLYKDFGSDEKGVNIFGYIRRKYGLPYRDVLELIAKNFNIRSNGITFDRSFVVGPENDKKQHKSGTILQIKKREWTLDDKKYWYENYFIDKKLLESYNVYPIQYYYINFMPIRAALFSYSYNYYWNNGRFLRKIYQPKSKSKWISNVDNTIVQGIDNIPKRNDLLIITKSLKDVMVLNLLGFASVAPNNETSWLPEPVWNKFQDRYKEMYVFFDNDEAGRFYSNKMSKIYGVRQIELPTETGAKDISDFMQIHKSLDLTKKQILKLL